MKNKVICKKLELIHISNINIIANNYIELESGKEFYSLVLENKAEYSCQSQQNDAGTILNETVTAKIRNNNDLLFLKSSLKYYVLKLSTDTQSFIVGSIDYPCVMNFEDNNIYINISFKSSKPIY